MKDVGRVVEHFGVAPPGGAAAAIGTNPIAFGFPTEGGPLSCNL